MRNFDFAPLYRATIGFDQIADLMDRVLASEGAGSQTYPPYNIEKLGDDQYRISIAVAGFAPDELTLEQRENVLVVSARKDAEPDRTYLHRGIATRAFDRTFHLADHVHVTDARQVDGMLHIDLKREVPEALKPRRIAISSAPAPETKLVN